MMLWYNVADTKVNVSNYVLVALPLSSVFWELSARRRALVAIDDLREQSRNAG